MSTMRKRSSPVPWHQQVAQCLWYGLLALTTILITSSHVMGAFVPVFSQEPIIVSQEVFLGSCVHGSNWTSSPGACDRIVCYVVLSGTYTVTHSCRPREPSENPDTDNCQWVSDSSQSFPDCCPILECSAASPLSTVDPTLCRDLAESFSCQVWRNLTSGCSDPSSDVYSITQTYCNNTCGIC